MLNQKLSVIVGDSKQIFALVTESLGFTVVSVTIHSIVLRVATHLQLKAIQIQPYCILSCTFECHFYVCFTFLHYIVRV